MCHLHKDAFLASIVVLREGSVGGSWLSFWAGTQQRRLWTGGTGGASEFVLEALPSSSTAEYLQLPQYLAT